LQWNAPDAGVDSGGFSKGGGGGTSLGLGGVDSGCKLSQIASYRNFLRGSINKLKGTKVTTIVVCHLPTYRSFYPCMIHLWIHLCNAGQQGLKVKALNSSVLTKNFKTNLSKNLLVSSCIEKERFSIQYFNLLPCQECKISERNE